MALLFMTRRVLPGDCIAPLRAAAMGRTGPVECRQSRMLAFVKHERPPSILKAPAFATLMSLGPDFDAVVSLARPPGLTEALLLAREGNA